MWRSPCQKRFCLVEFFKACLYMYLVFERAVNDQGFMIASIATSFLCTKKG